MSQLSEIAAQLDEREKEILRKKFSEEFGPKINQHVTVFFPDKYHKDPIDIYTTEVPMKGDTYVLYNMSTSCDDPRFDFNTKDVKFRWKVKKVMRTIRVQSTAKDRLVYEPLYRVEIILTKDWFYELKWELKFQFWHMMRRVKELKLRVKEFFSNGKA